MRKRLIAGTVSLLMLGALGCSESSGEPGVDKQSSRGEALTEVTAGVIPIVDTAAIWLGKDQGFFEDEGIDLTIQPVTGGAAAIPGVLSGDFTFAFGNMMSLMIARDKGLDVRAVANATTASGDLQRDFGAVVVSADSPIRTAADLAGKTLSVNNLANIGDTTIRMVVEQAGGDESTLKFVEVAFAEASASLANGHIDAAWIVDPFLTEALAAGARVVSYNFVEVDPHLDISAYFTDGNTLETDPDLVERFTRAIRKAMEYADEHPAEVRRIVATYTKIAPELLESVQLPAFRTEFNREGAELLGAAAVRFGTLTEQPDLDALLP